MHASWIHTRGSTRSSTRNGFVCSVAVPVSPSKPSVVAGTPARRSASAYSTFAGSSTTTLMPQPTSWAINRTMAVVLPMPGWPVTHRWLASTRTSMAHGPLSLCPRAMRSPDCDEAPRARAGAVSRSVGAGPQSAGAGAQSADGWAPVGRVWARAANTGDDVRTTWPPSSGFNFPSLLPNMGNSFTFRVDQVAT